MKMKILPVIFALALSIITSSLSTAFAQGSLTPPGAPAPTMKSLDQIEARTPISSAPFTITNSGSYYLTTNLTVSTGDAIDINTNGVTLDLNGFTISSTAASATGTAILLKGNSSDITIINGHIRSGVTNSGGVFSGSGFDSGINYYYSGDSIYPANVLVSRVSVSGCLHEGIYLGYSYSAVVESCTVRTVGDSGIVATTIKQCSAMGCGGTAMVAKEATDCTGRGDNSVGISATTAANCYGDSSAGPGIDSTTAVNCYGSSATSIGIYTTTAANCHGYSLTGDGILAQTATSCYGETSGSAAFGIKADSAQNCYAYNFGSGTGLYATQMAIGCYGYASSGTGLSAYIANSCVGATSTGTAKAVTYKYNMP